MANKRLKKLTALLLSIVMVFSMVTEAFPAAFAAEEAGGSTPQAETPNFDFSTSKKTRRPGLYVDFLGDNHSYQAPADERDTVVGSSAVLNGLVAPGKFDQSSVTNKQDATTNLSGTTNTWAGYHANDKYSDTTGDVVFWVGVGISRMNMLELFEQRDDGIYGLELGFYYDNRYIEPYTGGAADDNAGYRAIIEAANLTNYESYKWDGYRIVDARTDLIPQTDPVTQEVIQNPNMDEIMGRVLPNHNPDGLTESPWRMTYVSIEKTNVVTNRFNGLYDASKTAEEDLETRYLLLIPFKLKKYDTQWQNRVCLRLARSAGLLSIGGGNGDTPYAAWERVTTRNPGRELKLMTDFQGDLNIFSGGRYLEPSYKANLIIEKAGGDDNKAQLAIRNDPSPNPVVIDQSGQAITGLYGGTGMEVKVHVATGYKAIVEVYYSSTEITDTNKTRTYIIDPAVLDAAVKNEEEYIFIMPEADATVRVTFEVTNAAEFRLYLDEKEQDKAWNDVPKGTDTGIRGNSTVLTATHTDNTTTPGTPIVTTVVVDKDSPADNSLSLPAEMVRYSSEVRADIKLHGDYEAVVWFTNAAQPPAAVTDYDIDPASGTTGRVDGKKIILSQSGTVILRSNMPESDVVAHVVYRPAEKRTVILEVHHENIPAKPANVAQLATTVFTKENVPQAGYSGVVYQGEDTIQEPDRYRRVETDFRVIDRVDVSSAAGSGSLGGDGRAPMAWSGTEESLMALLAKATQADDLKTVKTLDLRWDSAPGTSTPPAALSKQPVNGIRKNALGERYTDQEMTDFYDRLWELKGLADAAIAGGATSLLVDVPDTANPGQTLYSYYDLSWQQVQAYILDYEARKTYEDAKTQYDQAKAQYDLDKAAYDKYQADLAASTTANPYTGPVVRKPKLPMAPLEVSQPVLRDQASAEKLLNDKTTENGGTLWYKPSATTDPPTRPSNMSEGYKLEVRPGRKMAVVLEAESTYTVAKSIKIKKLQKDLSGNVIVDANGNPVTNPSEDIVLDDASGKLVSSTSYQNEFLFDMPDYDCIVEVTYTERKAHDLELQVIGDYDKSTPSVKDNNVTVTGYGPSTTGGIAAAAITPLTTDKETARVLEDSTVSILVHVDTDNYDVQVHVGYDDVSGGTANVATVPDVSSVTSVADGTLITFKMPAVRDGGKARVVVTYTSKKPFLDAHLRLIGDAGSSTGYWAGTANLMDTTAHGGDALKANINVAPGYYIYAVEAHTPSGSYPFTLSGNGWNNGAGGPVTIDTIMPDMTLPDKDYWVYVEFRKGPPEPEPGQFLTLRVNDPDNEGPAFADNWAKAEIYRNSNITPTLTMGPLKKTTTTALEGIAIREHAVAGDRVKVTFKPADGYVVESVVIQPSGVGATPIRTLGNGGNEVEFTMPAASAAVVVTFRKKENAAKSPLYLHLNKTENGTLITDNGTGRPNRLVSATSPTIDATGSGGTGGIVNVPGTLPASLPTGSSGDTGIAKPGETVKVNLNVDPGWYVHSITVSGSHGRVSYDLWQTYIGAGDPGNVKYDPTTHYHAAGTGTAIPLVATFVMPDSDAHVTVHYRKGPDDPSQKPDPDPSEREVELVVEDPENATTPYADNNASAVVSGIDASRTIAAVGKAKDALRRVTSARAGEKVTIDYSAAAGYTLEIILVTPAGLHVPVNYLTSGKAWFTMPDSSVTAIVRFKKLPAIQYTANLVLHFPTGTVSTNYDKIGEGSFRTGTTGLDRPNPYPDGTKLYSQLALPGDRLDFDLLAHDGYYIEAVTVGPDELGVEAPYTGSFGRQSGYVIMPAASIQINVYFKAGWPDDVKPDPETVDYDLTLKVYDAAGSSSYANFESIGTTALTAPNSNPVRGGESLTVTPRQSYDEDRVVVKLHPDTGCYAQSITVTDSRGKDVPWQYAPGGIAFEMVPAHVTVTVQYAKLPEFDPTDPNHRHTVTLHVNSASGTGDVTAMGIVKLTGPDAGQLAQADGENFAVVVPPQGQTMTLEVKPNNGYHVVVAYAVNQAGETLPLVAVGTGSGEVTRGMPQVAKGGTVTFAMPDSDADVYVIFAKSDDPNTPGPDLTRGDLPGTLTVVGPTGSGSAVMSGTIESAGTPPVFTPVTTGTVSATGANSLFAPQETKLTVDLTVADGFGIKAIRVVDAYGLETPYTWTNNDQRQFTLTMPAGGVHVYVELEKVTPRPTDPNDPGPEDSQLTAQVVVNNGGNPGNTALLRYDPTDGSAAQTGTLLSPVYAGDRIHLELTVQPGYRVEYVKVVPAKYGFLPRIDVEDPSFLMPGEDVVVYVKFADDGRDRRNVTLKAVSDNLEDTNNPIQDMATIENEDTKIKGDVVHPVTAPNSTQIQVGPATATQDAEWVVVDYGWAAEHAIKSLTVTDASGNPVPFTQVLNDQTNRKGKIRFPMVDSDVTVTIEWGTKEELPKFDVVLHVIDLDTNTEITGISWGQLTWLNPPTGEANIQTSKLTALPAPGSSEILKVPAGEKVQVDTDTVSAGVYIQAAYVLYRAGGQMISFNFTPDSPGPGFSGPKTDTFVVHPGQNDVYVYFTKVVPVENDYAAVVMLDSPETYDATNGSKATITRTPVRTAQGETAAPSDTVTANDVNKTHGYVTATENDTITVTVTPAQDYSIESILMTPLGTSTDQGGPVVITKTGNTYTFTMPAHNVAVRIKLKKGEAKEYKATLHYKRVVFETGQPPKIEDINDSFQTDWAYGDFTGMTTTPWRTDGEVRNVPEGTSVTVGASITAPSVGAQADYVLAAYVLNEKGTLVPFGPALEGLTETHATPDPNKTDGTGSFTMPGEDVHIYVWFTNEKPTEKWYTAVLTVVDSDPNAADPLDQVNSGLNSATINSSTSNTTPIEVWSTGVTGNTKRPEKLHHKFIWVTKDETVTVKTAHIETGYSYVNTTSSNSISTGGPTLTGPATDMNHTATFVVGECNTAVVVEYKASPVTRNPLNVVLIDRDNPGDGVTKNSARVSPTGMTPLDIDSVTAAGARQRIPGVQSGIPVKYTAAPYTGYTYVARLKDNAGQDITPSDWTMNAPGTFTMPGGETTLEITYFKARKATLVVQDTRGIMAAPDTSKADMAEDAFGGTVTASSDGTKGTFAALPGGTELSSAGPTMPAGTRLIGVIVTDSSGSRLLAPDAGDGNYRYTIANSDVEIKMIVGPDTDNQLLASVSAVNLPAGTDAPTIAVTNPGPNATSGSNWTVAANGNTVTVTVKVPEDYEADLTTDNGTTLSATTMTADGTATFTMPATNTHVTVTYRKTAFKATIVVAPAAGGSATLSDGVNTVTANTAADTLYHLAAGTSLTYTATPNAGYTLARVLMTTASGAAQLLTGGTVAMPADDVTITVFFDDDNNRHHIAYVTTAGTDGLPGNAAQNIKNESSSTLDTPFGTLYTYGDDGHSILVNFTTDPDYWADVTATDSAGNPVTVNQQGITGACTAKITMPHDVDVEIKITYHKQDVDPPKDKKLTLRLVGHGQEADNQATLKYTQSDGTTGTLSLVGNSAPDTSPYYSGSVPVQAGAALDLDAWRKSDFVFDRMTVSVWNGNLADPIIFNEVDLSWNEYLTNGVSLLTMPNAETLVTVYYRLPYQVTLFVIDSDGSDYNDGQMPPGAADTAVAPHDRVPTVTMSVDNTNITTNNPTTKTHTPITDLDGKEKVTTQVDTATLPTDTSVASVIVTTPSGTTHLTETVGTAGEYLYMMSDSTSTPVRRAANAEITVILRDETDPRMYTATVYKVGHDDKPGNTAKIKDVDKPTMPFKGDIWTGAYPGDQLQVDVTTESGYYAVVTAKTVGGIDLAVLQYDTQSTPGNPIKAILYMPDGTLADLTDIDPDDVDVTVTYTTDKPQSKLWLILEGHEGNEKNTGTVDQVTTNPDTTETLTRLLTAPKVDPTDSTKYIFQDGPATADSGIDLRAQGLPDDGYTVEKIELVVTVGTSSITQTLTMDALNKANTKLPVGDNVKIVITFKAGDRTPRPFDPWHSEKYVTCLHGTTGYTDYVVGTDTGDNPDLSDTAKDGADGWILGESTGEALTILVPTLFEEKTYDTEKANAATGDVTKALEDAGENAASTDPKLILPPVYKLYWLDDNGKYQELKADVDMTVTSQNSVLAANNPHGMTHIGYQLVTIVPKKDSTTGKLTTNGEKLAEYISNGGTLYITATRQWDETEEGASAPTRKYDLESFYTQVVISSAHVRPYDPDRVNPDGTANPTYEDHWIRAENRGDYLIVTVPMLNTKSGDTPTAVDGTKHRLQLHLQVDGTNRDSTIVNVTTDYLNIQNVRDYENFWNVNLEYDPDWRTAAGYTSYLFDPFYENGVYYTGAADPGPDNTPGTADDIPYTGAKFVVSIKEEYRDPDSTDPVALALQHIFDNYGTMNPGDTINNDPKYQNCRMYITSDEVKTLADPLPTFRKDDYTDFEVPRYYSLAGVLQSWAPTHIAELTLYRADAGTASGYKADPWLMLRSGLCKTMSSTGNYPPSIYNGHWSMDFAFKSSELVAEDGTALTYQMVVEKTSHLTYTHTAIELDTTAFTGALYDAGTQKFSFASPVSLFCGDIAPTLPGPNQLINDQDRNLLAGFNYGTYAWNAGESDTATDWGESTYNPYSYAYMADLNGDGIISEQDMAILMSEFNWKRRTRDYGDPSGLDFSASGIMLLLEDFLDGEATGDEAAEGEQPGEDAEEGTDPEKPSDSAEDPKDPENPDGTGNTEDPDHPEDPQEPVTPEDPKGSEGPDAPDDPEGTTEPVTPDTPKEPDGSTEPESPDEPKNPDGTDIPEGPEEPIDSDLSQPETDPDQTPADPEAPSEPEDPETQEKSEEVDLTAPSGESAPKQPNAESEGAPPLEQKEEGSGGEAADPVSTTDPDQSAEKNSLTEDKL